MNNNNRPRPVRPRQGNAQGQPESGSRRSPQKSTIQRQPRTGSGAGSGNPSSASVRKNSGRTPAVSAGKKNTKKKKSFFSFFRRHDERNKKRQQTVTGSMVSGLVKAVIYIVCILVVSGVLSYFGISVANEAFAFVKKGQDITVLITEDTDISGLADILKREGIINYAKIFDIYAGIRYEKGKDQLGNPKKLNFEPGEYVISTGMSYDEMIAAFLNMNDEERTTVVVTIPEGFTAKQIIETVVNKYGLSDIGSMTDAINSTKYDYWFVDRLKKENLRKGRTYLLEGYLYPDTYYYYSDAQAVTIVNKMLSNFDKKLKQVFGNDYINTIDGLCDKHNMTFDDIIIMASLIQMEAKFEEDYPGISAVFHNRLKYPAALTQGKLQSDATIQYALDKRVADLTAEQMTVDSLYNTYLYEGLPPGPITNPTFGTIHFAAYPEGEDNKNYFYFLTDSNGHARFAEGYEEHQENIRKYLLGE